MTCSNIKVAIKVRPLIAREKNENLLSQWTACENSIKSTNKEYEMSFDHIFDETKSTMDLFDTVARPIVASALRGINGTIFAYGQTSSGKTYSMMGTKEELGIVPLVVREIFEQIESLEESEFLIRIGYIEIYNERIFDLLEKGRPEIPKLYESVSGETNVKLCEVIVSSEDEIMKHYELGNSLRQIAETSMNDRSSRSHTIFRITIESQQRNADEDSGVQISNLNLVDLAGSERAVHTKASGKSFKEGTHINKSLLSLSKVIRELSEASENGVEGYINYRDSKLTRILSASLGGNAMTSIICTVTPATLEETYYTLLFAHNAKKIKNKPKVNQILSDQAIMKKLEKEIARLQLELEKQQSINSEMGNIKSLEQQISRRENQFLHSTNATIQRVTDKSRRRTWAPSTINDSAELLMPPPAMAPVPPFMKDSKSRYTTSPILCSDNFDDEEFRPAEEFNLDRTLSPMGRSTDSLSNLIRTPMTFRNGKSNVESPNPLKPDMVERIRFLENEIKELNDFQRLESQVGRSDPKLEHKLRNATNEINKLETELEEMRCLTAEKDSAIQELAMFKAQMEISRKQCQQAIKDKQDAENILASVQYEFDLAKEKSKSRINELIQSLDEAREESRINELHEKFGILEAKLKKTEEENFALQTQLESCVVPPSESETMHPELHDRVKELEELVIAANFERDKIQMQFLKESELAQSSQKDLHKRINELEKIMKSQNDDFCERDKKAQVLQSDLQGRVNELEIIIETTNSERDAIKVQLEEKLGKEQSSENDLQSRIRELEKIMKSQNDDFCERAKQAQVLQSDLQGRVNELQILIEKTNSERDAIKMQLEEKLEKEQSLENDLQSRIRELEKVVASISCERDKIEQNFNDKRSEMNVMRLEYDQISTQLMENIDENESLRHKVEKLEDAMKDSHQTNAEIQAQFAVAKEDGSKYEMISKMISSLGNEQFREIEIGNPGDDETLNMVVKLCKYAEKYKYTEDAIIELRNEINDLQDEKTQLLAQLPTIVEQEDPEPLKLEIESLHEKLSSSQKELEALRAQLIEAEEISKSVSDKNKLLVANNAELCDEINRHTSDMSTTTDDDHISSLQQQLMASEESCKELLKQIDSLKQEVDEQTLKVKILEDALTAQSTEMTSEIAELKTGLTGLMTLGEENARLKIVEKEFKKQLEAHITARSSMEAQKQKLIEMQLTVASMKENSEQLIAKISEKEETIAHLQINNENLIEKNVQLQKDSEEIETLREANLILEIKVHELSENLLNVQRDIDSDFESIARITLLEEQNESLTLILKDSNEKQTNLSKELELLKSKYDLMQSKSSNDDELRKLAIMLEAQTESYQDLQQKHSVLDAENTDRASELVLKHEENQKLTTEIVTLKEELERRAEEYADIKNLHNRHSFDSERELKILEDRNSSLQSQYQKLQQALNENDQKYVALNEKHNEMSELYHKLEKEYKDLLEKHQTPTQHPKLQAITAENERLQHEIIKLNEKIRESQSESFIHCKTIADLRDELLDVQRQLDEHRKMHLLKTHHLSEHVPITKKSISPEKRRSCGISKKDDELFASQNQMQLDERRPTPNRQTLVNDRRVRRQSVHDEHRRLSVWEQSKSDGTQTDPVGELCACIALNDKLVQMTRDFKLKECRVKHLETMAKKNPLQYDVDQLKKSLAREQREHSHTKSELDAMSHTLKCLQKKALYLELNQIVPKKVETLSTQTEIDARSIDLERSIEEKSSIERKHNELKKICRQQQEKIIELQQLAEKEKENYCGKLKIEIENTQLKRQLQEIEEKYKQYKNSTPILRPMEPKMQSNQTIQTDDELAKVSIKSEEETLREDYQMLQRKYNQTKRLCNLRYDDIGQMKAEIIALKNQITDAENKRILSDKEWETSHINLHSKYQQVKQICQMRHEKIKELTAQLELGNYSAAKSDSDPLVVETKQNSDE